MLNMPTIGEAHLQMREHLTSRHSHLMETIINFNAHKKKYWILGKAVSKRKNRKTIIKPVLKALDEKPEVQKESYLYEIDNEAGTQTLLWVMHPNNKLALPCINKSIRVADESGV